MTLAAMYVLAILAHCLKHWDFAALQLQALYLLIHDSR